MLRLRQIALITADLQQSYNQVCAVFGITEGYEDPAVAEFGLKNVILTLGDTYIELLTPVNANTAAARFLERHGGAGGYMLILQTDDLSEMSRRVAKLGIRKTWEKDFGHARVFHMHPKDTGGAILSFDEMSPMESWAWAGPDWERRAAKLVGNITAVEVLSPYPAQLAERWEQLFEREASHERGGWHVPLDKGTVRIYGTEGRIGEGIGAIEVEAHDQSAVLAAAAKIGVPVIENAVTLCGVQFQITSREVQKPSNL